MLFIICLSKCQQNFKSFDKLNATGQACTVRLCFCYSIHLAAQIDKRYQPSSYSFLHALVFSLGQETVQPSY